MLEAFHTHSTHFTSFIMVELLIIPGNFCENLLPAWRCRQWLRQVRISMSMVNADSPKEQEGTEYIA